MTFWSKIILIFFLAIIVLLVKHQTVQRVYKKNLHEISIAAYDQKDTSIYFIGSSRISFGVDNLLISRELKGRKVFNCGFTGSAFFNNCLLAEGLIKTKGNKIIFIEICPLLPEIEAKTQQFMEALDLDVAESVFALGRASGVSPYRKFYLNILNSALLNSFSLQDDLKLLLRIEKPVIPGFTALTGNGYRKTDSYLSRQMLSGGNSNLFELKQYQAYINYLLQACLENNAKIFFLLPLTYMRTEEKKIVSELFYRIQSENKITYSEAFLEQVTNLDYLFDINHFNAKGAETYSKFLVPVIDSILRIR